MQPAAGESKLDKAQDRIIELEHLLAITVAVPKPRPAGIKSPQVYRVLVGLSRHAFVPRGLLTEIIRPNRDKEYAGNGAEVILHQARQWAREHGIDIKNRFGEGWFVEDRRKLAELLDTTKP